MEHGPSICQPVKLEIDNVANSEALSHQSVPGHVRARSIRRRLTRIFVHTRKSKHNKDVTSEVVSRKTQTMSNMASRDKPSLHPRRGFRELLKWKKAKILTQKLRNSTPVAIGIAEWATTALRVIPGELNFPDMLWCRKRYRRYQATVTTTDEENDRIMAWLYETTEHDPDNQDSIVTLDGPTCHCFPPTIDVLGCRQASNMVCMVPEHQAFNPCLEREQQLMRHEMGDTQIAELMGKLAF